jgi:hypothetical protein
VLTVRNCVGGRFNAERLQQPHDLGAHSLIDSQSAE